jgi:hypothetical protein
LDCALVPFSSFFNRRISGVPHFPSCAFCGPQWAVDRDNASMPMQTPKISVLEPYGDFSIALQEPSIASLAIAAIVLFLNWSNTGIAGLPATASKNTNDAEDSGSYS